MPAKRTKNEERWHQAASMIHDGLTGLKAHNPVETTDSLGITQLHHHYGAVEDGLTIIEEMREEFQEKYDSLGDKAKENDNGVLLEETLDENVGCLADFVKERPADDDHQLWSNVEEWGRIDFDTLFEEAQEILNRGDNLPKA